MANHTKNVGLIMPERHDSANFQLMLLNRSASGAEATSQPVARRDADRLNRVHWLLVEHYQIGIADYLLFLTSAYSLQVARHLLLRNLNQEVFFSTYDTPPLCEVHAANADLIRKALRLLTGGAM
jgi:hypothetical protein